MAKFARKCSVTGKVMNEGWYIAGEYAADENSADFLSRKLGYESFGVATDDENSECYWTEWALEEDDYYDENGVNFVDGIPQVDEPKYVTAIFGDITFTEEPREAHINEVKLVAVVDTNKDDAIEDILKSYEGYIIPSEYTGKIVFDGYTRFPLMIFA